MKPHAYDLISLEDQEIFYQIETIFKELPEIDLGVNNKGKKILVSCHMLTRAFTQFFPVKFHDGYCGNPSDFHSWLTLSSTMIDIYPIAVIGGPILIDKKIPTPFSRLYVVHELPEFAYVTNMTEFNENVKKVTEIVEQTIEKLKMKLTPQKDF